MIFIRWVDVPDWENYYEISDEGKVRNKLTGHIISEDRSNRSGYVRVTLYKKPLKKKFLLHRLVMLSFCGSCDLEVNHKDSNKMNNSLDNLEYVTRKENELHCRMYGNKKHLYKPFIVEFSNGVVVECSSRKELADMIGVTRECVKNWLHKKTRGYDKYGIRNIEYVEIYKCQTTNCSA